jgi:hypothetical protein
MWAKNISPGLPDVDDIDTIRASFPEVRLHVHLEVFGTKVTLSSKEHLNVLRSRIEDRRKIGGNHDERLVYGWLGEDSYDIKGKGGLREGEEQQCMVENTNKHPCVIFNRPSSVFLV